MKMNKLWDVGNTVFSGKFIALCVYIREKNPKSMV